MRTLKILGVVQTVLLLVLVGKVFLFADDSTGADPLTRAEPTARPGVVSTDTPSMDIVTTNRSPGDERLRTIIREELATLAGSLSAESGHSPGDLRPEPIDSEELEYQRELVSGQIDFYMSVGSISGMEMARLENEIRKLDKKSAELMLMKLAKAIGSGQLEGEL